MALGAWQFTKLSIDAVPDITNVQVVVNTHAPGYTPLETEQRITYPIETAMSGLAKLDYTRSTSRYGLSKITIVFEEGTDIYFARQLVSERLSSIRSQLPANLEPALGPVTTGLGEVFMFTVDAAAGATNKDGSAITPMDLRSVHDWIIRPQLMRLKGVAEVNPIGGYKKEILIAPYPNKLLAYQISYADVVTAIQNNNSNRGTGFIEKNGSQWLMRVPGQAKTLDDLANIVISQNNGIPIFIKDVAQVSLGKELRSGAATKNGQEVVMSVVSMLIGENSRAIASSVAAKLEQIKPSLPEGIIVTAVYDRTSLVDKTLQTIQKNLLEGAILVMVVLFLFLGNIRAAILTAAVIPIAMLMTITGMVQTKTSANLMSLGALDFGLIVDGAVIIVDNCIRHLSKHNKEGQLNLKQRLEVVFKATFEVIRPALFGAVIIMVVYLPIFALSGVEGKMFHPMAITVIIALMSAMLLSVTFIPAGVALLLNKPIKQKKSLVTRTSLSLYRPILSLSLKYSKSIVLTSTLLVIGVSSIVIPKLGAEFMPNLDEGDIAMHALRIPGTSLSESINLQKTLEAEIKKMPEVARVFTKIGTDEIAADAMPPNVSDNFIILKPREQWPDPDKSKEQIIADLEILVNPLPGNLYEFLQPIQMRFNELMSGVRSEVAIKIMGDDFEQLIKLGHDIEAIVKSVDGAADVAVEQITGLPVLNIEPNRTAMSRYGLSLVELQDLLATALAGTVAGTFYEGDRRANITVRLAENLRTDIDALSHLPVILPNGRYVPLKEVATIQQISGFSQINRENGKRKIVVTANVRGRDLASFVTEIKAIVNQKINPPDGYWIEYAGTYQKLQSATQRLIIVVPITLVLIIILLVMATRSSKDALIIFSGVPFALIGGILALLLRDIPFSISAAVGFIALSGIAVLNGLVMISFIQNFRQQNYAIQEAIIKGATTRLRPVLMTALVASLGFVPMALNTGIGSEVQRPLATVVIGGIITSTLLTLVVLPALYRLVHERLVKKIG